MPPARNISPRNSAERLRIAGAVGRPIFSRQAIDAVYLYSLGIPRVVNLLCEHVLVNAFVEQQQPDSKLSKMSPTNSS